MPVSALPLGILLQAARPEPDLLQYIRLGKLGAVAVLLAATWLIIRYSVSALDYIGGRSVRARFVVKWIQPVVRIVLWFGAFLIGFDILAPTRESFLAGVASAGIAIALGAQDLVRNLIGGLVILADRPFQLGDRVRIGDAYGEIDHIGLYSTRLTTPDDTRVTIPNSQVVGTQVFNANSGVPDCQVVTDLYLPPTADPDEAVRIAYDAVHSSPFLLSSKPVVVLASDFLTEQAFLRVRVKAYVYDHRFEARMQSDITVRAKVELIRRGLLKEWERGAGEEA